MRPLSNRPRARATIAWADEGPWPVRSGHAMFAWETLRTRKRHADGSHERGNYYRRTGPASVRHSRRRAQRATVQPADRQRGEDVTGIRRPWHPVHRPAQGNGCHRRHDRGNLGLRPAPQARDLDPVVLPGRRRNPHLRPGRRRHADALVLGYEAAGCYARPCPQWCAPSGWQPRWPSRRSAPPRSRASGSCPGGEAADSSPGKENPDTRRRRRHFRVKIRAREDAGCLPDSRSRAAAVTSGCPFGRCPGARTG